MKRNIVCICFCFWRVLWNQSST